MQGEVALPDLAEEHCEKAGCGLKLSVDFEGNLKSNMKQHKN